MRAYLPCECARLHAGGGAPTRPFYTAARRLIGRRRPEVRSLVCKAAACLRPAGRRQPRARSALSRRRIRTGFKRRPRAVQRREFGHPLRLEARAVFRHYRARVASGGVAPAVQVYGKTPLEIESWHINKTAHF